MTRISSRFTTFHKRIFPALPLVVAAALFLGDLFKNGVIAGATLLGPFLMGIVSLGIGFRVWDLVDEVYDCYDHLLVRNHGLEEAIPLSKVMHVSASVTPNYPRITLRLVEPCLLGGDRLLARHGVPLNRSAGAPLWTSSSPASTGAVGRAVSLRCEVTANTPSILVSSRADYGRCATGNFDYFYSALLGGIMSGHFFAWPA